MTAKGVPGRKVLTAYLRHHAATPDPMIFELPDAARHLVAAHPERQRVDVPAILAAAHPSIERTVDPDAIAAAIATDPEPTAPASTPEPSTASEPAADEAHADRLEPAIAAPPIVTALAAVGRLADELASLRPRLTARDRRVVDATLVALGTPDPSLLGKLFGT